MMDESLANGFKNQFFKYVHEELDTAFRRAAKAQNKTDYYAKLTNWTKFTTALIAQQKTHC